MGNSCENTLLSLLMMMLLLLFQLLGSMEKIVDHTHHSNSVGHKIFLFREIVELKFKLIFSALYHIFSLFHPNRFI